MKAEVKGWCPSAYRPMMSGDGLVVRVRPPLRRLSVEQARGLGDLAARYGNGEIAVTSRLNLQLRGVSEADFEFVLDGLRAVSLVEETQEAEARENILLAPMRSDDRAEVIAAEISQGLAVRADLPSKFGVLVDVEPEGRQLANVSGDIRVERGDGGSIVRADGCATGHASRDVVADVLALVDWFLDHGVGSDGRGRMRDVAHFLADDWQGETPLAAVSANAPGACAEGFVVAGEFGAFSADVFRGVAHEIAVLPGRMLMLLRAADAPGGVISAADDPLLSVAACVGAPACDQGQVETRDVARCLAGRVVHVSGCDKGCANPGKSETTLVGRDGFFDLVKNGRASDTPVKRGLTPEEVIKELGGV